MLKIKSSITGFHNPKKHKGMTPDEFLTHYIKRQASRAYNGNQTNDRASIVVCVLAQWDKWIKEVEKLFPATFGNVDNSVESGKIDVWEYVLGRKKEETKESSKTTRKKS